MPGQRRSTHRRVICVLLTALAVPIAACQSVPSVTEQWTPPYLELHLYAGKAQVQWSDGSEWTKLEGKASIVIENKGRITADAVEGAQFYLGDGSTLEMGPGTVIEVQNPRTLPRLQMVVRDGSLLFFAQKPSYEFVMPACPVTFLSVPALIRIEVNGETTRLAVEGGAVNCELETETLTLPTCRQMHIRPGEEGPTITDFCTPSTVVAPPTPTPSPDSTPMGSEPALTGSPSPTSTPTRGTVAPTPTRGEVVPTFTPTPVPPTKPPAPPKPQPTKPPPPPTEPPPSPTEPPPPPPTEPPPPPPTEPPRPTPAPPEPTAAPPEPTRAQTEPTAAPPEPTSAPPRPTTEPS